MPAAMHLTVLLSLLTATACRGEERSFLCYDDYECFPCDDYECFPCDDYECFLSNVIHSENINRHTPASNDDTDDHQSYFSFTTDCHGREDRPEQRSPEHNDHNDHPNVQSKRHSGPDGNKENYNLVENPGLVTVICIFSIVFGLLLVVLIVKCVRSSRSDFERLEDVPMGKVNEASPFAHFLSRDHAADVTVTAPGTQPGWQAAEFEV
ncbi:hypothetical protein CCH79_00009377 [Gambusia affinis]|uniref:TNFR-Cys domain-containing protein n=1 Tax=Gambusia affinis TaxID=33528 RepID=A0A315VE81_GAMAF|nr:hypothetical protein CCH79_00009377 [Gambusia affinis]